MKNYKSTEVTVRGCIDDEKYLIFNGTHYEIIEQIARIMTVFSSGKGDVDKENAELIFDTLKKYQKILGDDEILKSFTEDNTSGKKLVLEEERLYINIRRITFLLLVKLLDRELPPLFEGISFVNEICSIYQNKPAISFLKEIEGELCILMETAKSGKKGTDQSLLLLDNPRQECINNHYKCNYNHDGKCNCSPETVKDILDHLHQLGVLKIKRGKYYYVSDFLLDLSTFDF